MMNRYMISSIAAALLISPLAFDAVASNTETNRISQSPATQLTNRRRRGGHGPMKQVLEQLNLTPEQSQKIDAIHEQLHSENETLLQEMRTNHQEMRSLLASDASDEQLRQQHQKNQDLNQKLGNNHFETMLQVREILTPEQRSQMAELMEKKRVRSRNPNDD